MLVAEQLMQTQKQFEKTLTLIDQFILPTVETVDTNTKIFFVFKPYPKQLKRKQIEQWALLQCTSLSPFIGGQHYQYLSKAGLHLWICQDKFYGVPETAMQNTLPDGNHLVAGITHWYQQTWRNGLLINCFCIDRTEITPDIMETVLQLPYDKAASWAVTREIDKQLKKPSIWLAITLFISLCASIWQISSKLTSSIQNSRAEEKIVELQDSLGEQLARQSQLQNQQQGLMTLQNWHNEFGFLPETFAAVAQKMNLQGEWQANAIAWQNGTLAIEIYSTALEIAILVAALEQSESLQKINIRPHANNNTWILEVTVK